MEGDADTESSMKQPEFVNSPLFPKELNAGFFSLSSDYSLV